MSWAFYLVLLDIKGLNLVKPVKVHVLFDFWGHIVPRNYIYTTDIFASDLFAWQLNPFLPIHYIIQITMYYL